MPSKISHRSAFASDPKFLERLAKQGVSPNVQTASSRQPEGSTQPSSRKPESKASTRMRKVREANMDGRNDRIEFEPMTKSLCAFFPGALLLGLNVMLRVHDAKSTALKVTWVKRIEAMKLEGMPVFKEWLAHAEYPVVVEEIYITPEGSLLDHESVAAACKPVLDAFVVNGFLPDDNGQFIAHPIAFTERGQNHGLLIRFKPTSKPWGLIDDDTMHRARTSMFGSIE
ncbi:hypothetical protein LCG56_28060 (plasmid) [Pseudomonas cannabina pv. alisalensis]|uniref:Uncharacterized protein n=1 Tax=Pseudomonas syringae pv. maculicola str. ES4326 TaxID=629265 RepID=A0A8T8CAW2_PSEYM|nr:MULTISPECIES: hypothetical protein [Pseudomonas syringae group]QHF00625.1 hypothetical protein PMA4326_029435 [Pseudomonas syringae pv. maculicola str. ES4326]UBZ00618.1 hypothetical protein LCG56_28060 [Pseudomonas cannabina pv. alisalensis]